LFPPYQDSVTITVICNAAKLQLLHTNCRTMQAASETHLPNWYMFIRFRLF